MIILSGVLVVVAIALLVAGIVAGNGESAQVFGLDALVVIYISIAVSIVSALCLAIGVFLRRRELFGGTGATPAPAKKKSKKAKKAADRSAAARAKSPAAAKDESADDGVAIPAPPADVPDDAGVFVVRGRKRYHLDTCRQLAGRDKEELTYSEAKEEGFSPCTACMPDTALAARAAVSVPAGPKKAAEGGPARPDGPGKPKTGAEAETAELPRTDAARPGGSAAAKPPVPPMSAPTPSAAPPAPPASTPPVSTPSGTPLGDAAAAAAKASPATPARSEAPAAPEAPAKDDHSAFKRPEPPAAPPAPPSSPSPSAPSSDTGTSAATGPLPSAWGAPAPAAPKADPKPEPSAAPTERTVTDLPLSGTGSPLGDEPSAPKPRESGEAAEQPKRPETPAAPAPAPAPEPVKREAADSPAPAASAASAASGASDADPQVRILSGTKRYHRTDCALIEDIGDEADDLEALSRAEAKARGCTPCLVCQPDKEHARD